MGQNPAGKKKNKENTAERLTTRSAVFSIGEEEENEKDETQLSLVILSLQEICE